MLCEKHHNGRHTTKGNVCGGELALTNWGHLFQLFSVMRKGGPLLKKISKNESLWWFNENVVTQMMPKLIISLPIMEIFDLGTSCLNYSVSPVTGAFFIVEPEPPLALSPDQFQVPVQLLVLPQFTSTA